MYGISVLVNRSATANVIAVADRFTRTELLELFTRITRTELYIYAIIKLMVLKKS